MLARQQFFHSTELIDPAFSRGAARILARAFDGAMHELNQVLPSAKATHFSAMETLPKVMKSLATPHDAPRGSGVYKRGEDCGLITMLTSASYARFVAALCGHAVEGPAAMQVLCIRPGDYAGPHTDHHPEEPSVRDGYTDVHFTFCTPGVKQQFIVYERGGHFAEMVDISRGGTLTAYRLPIWHYTTPMQGTQAARRWIVMNTFMHPGLPASSNAPRQPAPTESPSTGSASPSR